MIDVIRIKADKATVQVQLFEIRRHRTVTETRLRRAVCIAADKATDQVYEETPGVGSFKSRITHHKERLGGTCDAGKDFGRARPRAEGAALPFRYRVEASGREGGGPCPRRDLCSNAATVTLAGNLTRAILGMTMQARTVSCNKIRTQKTVSIVA